MKLQCTKYSEDGASPIYPQAMRGSAFLHLFQISSLVFMYLLQSSQNLSTPGQSIVIIQVLRGLLNDTVLKFTKIYRIDRHKI